MKRLKKGFVFLQSVVLIIPFVLVLFTPFIVEDELANGIITGKHFYFYQIMGLMVLVSPLLLKKSHLRFKIIDIIVFSFYVLGIIVSIYNIGYVNTKLILFTLLFALYIYCRFIFSISVFYRYILLSILLIVGAGEAIIGLLQLYDYSTSYHSLFKTTGTFFNPGPYAGYLSLTAPIAFYYLLKEYRIFKLRADRRLILFYLRFILSALAFITIILVLPASMSRASWISLLLSCIFIVLVLFACPKRILEVLKGQKVRTLIILSICVLIFIALCISGYHLKKHSADGRVLMWKVSVNAIVKNPLGVGLGGFSGVYGEAQEQYFGEAERSEAEQLVAGNPDYTFNEYLQICIELGIASFALFLSILVFAVFEGFKMKRYPELGALLALLVFASMSYPFSILPFLIVFVFLIASCSSAPNMYGKLSRDNSFIISVVGISLGLMVGICLYDRYPTYDAYARWKNSKYIYNMKLYEKSVAEYADLYLYLKDQPDFLFEYGQSLSQSGYWEKSNEVMEQATKINCDPMFYNIIAKNYQCIGNYAEAEKYLIKSIRLIPNRIYPYYLLAKLYTEWGRDEEAKNAANIVITKSPKVHTKAIDEMRNEMKDIINIEL